MLKSVTISVDQAVNPLALSISNTVLADTPLVADKDIAFYIPSSTTFGLTKRFEINHPGLGCRQCICSYRG